MTNPYARLTEARLRDLLLQKEGPTLDFKREWYKIGRSYPQDTRENQSGELIKDILALANNNADFAGDPSYLIIGADEPDTDGNPRLYGVQDTLPPQKELQQKINEFCSPPLGHLDIEPFQIDGCQLYVISIPPGPHLHETKKEIKASGRVYPEHTVFVRHGEHIQIASTRERITLMQIRQGRFRDSRNAPAWIVGATSGAALGGMLAFQTAELVLGDSTHLSSREKKLVSGTTGVGLGVFLGAMIGWIVNYFKETLITWPRKPLWNNLLSLLVPIGAGLAVAMLRKPNRTRKQ